MIDRFVEQGFGLKREICRLITSAAMPKFRTSVVLLTKEVEF